MNRGQIGPQSALLLGLLSAMQGEGRRQDSVRAATRAQLTGGTGRAEGSRALAEKKARRAKRKQRRNR